MPGRTKLSQRRTPLSLRLGRCIREARQAKKLSQERLAERAELSPNAIGNIERGEFDVTISTLKRVAHALGHTGAELLAAAKI